MFELFVYRDLYSVGIRASFSESTLNGPPRTGERNPLCLSCLPVLDYPPLLYIFLGNVTEDPPLFTQRWSTENDSDLQLL